MESFIMVIRIIGIIYLYFAICTIRADHYLLPSMLIFPKALKPDPVHRTDMQKSNQPHTLMQQRERVQYTPNQTTGTRDEYTVAAPLHRILAKCLHTSKLADDL